MGDRLRTALAQALDLAVLNAAVHPTEHSLCTKDERLVCTDRPSLPAVVIGSGILHAADQA